MRSRSGRDVLVGQRAVERAEGERERERAAPLADLLAAVDVEHVARRSSVTPPASRTRASSSAADTLTGSVTARSWRSAGNAPNALERVDLRRGRGELAEVDRERGGALQVPTTSATSGCTSPRKPSSTGS